MDNLGYMFAGFVVFWAAIFAYLLWLQARLRAVSRQLELLEERLGERSSQPAGRTAAPSAAAASNRS